MTIVKKNSGTLWPSCRDEPALAANGDMLLLIQIMLILICLKLKKKLGETGNNDGKSKSWKNGTVKISN